MARKSLRVNVTDKQVPKFPGDPLVQPAHLEWWDNSEEASLSIIKVNNTQ